jgi:Trypsin-like peptidase domain
MRRKSAGAPLWARLSTAERLKIAIAVARRRGPELMHRYRGVLSVGAGFRLQNHQPVADHVCLRFLVKRKRRRPGKQNIPSAIKTFILRRGKRTSVLIPTDVSELTDGRPHTNFTEGIVSQSSGELVEYGAACCVVKDQASPNDKYLLTCYHVASPNMQVPSGPTYCLNCATNARIGTFQPAVNSPTPGDPLDAALFAIGSNVPPVSVWGHVVTGKATDDDLMNLNTTTPLWILGRRQVALSAGDAGIAPRTSPASASFHTVWPSRSYPYPDAGGASFTYADTIEYAASTYPGDSGAALIDGDGTLYGMHFFGDGVSGYALSAPRVFDSGVFPIDVLLNWPN